MSATGILVVSPSGYPGNGSPLDLSRYMDVADGDGMDPASPSYSDRIFSHALLREGGVLALESQQLREMKFPLRLNATSRDGVAALVQEINVAVNAAGQTVCWQDQGSSQPTYFDLASGQFDVSYSFRKAGSYWIEGNLRLFVQPLGHTATMRLVASAAGTGPLLMLPVPSPILGDAPALMQANVRVGSSSLASSPYDCVALSVLPNGYTPEYQASALTGGITASSPGFTATLEGGSGAVASLFWRLAPTSLLYLQGSLPFHVVSFQPGQGTPYYGANRVFAVARQVGGPSMATGMMYMQATGLPSTQSLWVQTQAPASGQFAYMPPAMRDWQLLDLGTYTVPSSVATPLPLTLYVMYQSLEPTSVATFAPSAVDVTDVIVLPDGQTAFVTTQPTNALAPRQGVYFDGVNQETFMGAYESAPNWRLTPFQRGAVPKLPLSPSVSLAALVLPAGGAAAANDILNANVTVRERVRFAF